MSEVILYARQNVACALDFFGRIVRGSSVPPTTNSDHVQSVRTIRGDRPTSADIGAISSRNIPESVLIKRRMVASFDASNSISGVELVMKNSSKRSR